MPCYDGRSEESNNLAMRFCCETLSQMEKEGVAIPDYMKQWWDDHQKWDASQGRPHDKTTHVPKPKKKGGTHW